MLLISSCILTEIPSIIDLLPILSKYKTAPKFYARVVAASFPEGSIIPYNRSYTVIHAFYSRLAVVPGTTEAHLVTLK